MQTIHVATDLPTSADRVWSAIKHPASFTYVTRGLVGIPALAGRTDPIREGERGSAWLLAGHVLPVWRHTIDVVRVDEETMTLRTREHGGVIRVWNHALHVEPRGPRQCRYSDTVEIDAGRLTAAVAALAVRFYRHRQRRWHRLTRLHLLPAGPRWATPR